MLSSTALWDDKVCMKTHARTQDTHARDGHSTLGKTKTTIHHLTIMLSTSQNVLFPGRNHLLTSGADDPTL